jgi:Ca2+-binding RTX toxin-like protein
MTLSSFTYAAAGVLVAPAMVVLLSSPGQADVPASCRGHAATIVGTRGADHLVGTEGDDVIVGWKGQDVIDGLGGDDVICGNGGQDSLSGGDGADRLYGQWGTDSLSGGAGDDHLYGGVGWKTWFSGDSGDDTWVSWTTEVRMVFVEAPNGVTVDLAAGTAAGWGQDTITSHPWWAATPDLRVGLGGSLHDDVLLGSSRGDYIHSEGGTDTIDGRGGNDELFAESGNVQGGEGNDQVVVGKQRPDISVGDGGPGNDTLWTLGSARLQGGADDDTIKAGVYQFSIEPEVTFSYDGGDGRDTLLLSGFGRNPSLPLQPFHLDLAAGTLEAGGHQGTATGIEIVKADGRAAPYQVDGTDGYNYLDLRAYNGSAGVTVNARGGDDQIYTWDSDDTIDGGPGNEYGDAGAGTDTCISAFLNNCESMTP